MYKWIALIGLDGSGKSANIKRMQVDNDYIDYKFIWARWKPTLLRPAYWIFNQRISGNARECNKRTDELSSIILNENYVAKASIKQRLFSKFAIRSIWMVLAVIDYFFQFQFKTIKMAVGKKKLIFDRFYLDLFIDQGISFGYSPQQIDMQVKKYQWLFPNIDQVIYIRVSPETCLQRKNDIPNKDYLLKRFAVYEYLSNDPRWITVDGEKSLDLVNADIKLAILG